MDEPRIDVSPFVNGDISFHDLVQMRVDHKGFANKFCAIRIEFAIKSLNLHQRPRRNLGTQSATYLEN
jgi:hypothetical protein